MTVTWTTWNATEVSKVWYGTNPDQSSQSQEGSAVKYRPSIYTESSSQRFMFIHKTEMKFLEPGHNYCKTY